MNTRILMVAAVLVSTVACERGFNQKPPALKPAPGAPAPAKTLAAVDAQCPKGVEGLWEVRKVEAPVTADGNDSALIKTESFSVSRGAEGILQLNQTDLSQPIVLDGKARMIAFKKDGSVLTEGATYAGKCVENVIYVTETKEVAMDGEVGQVSQSMAYRMDTTESLGSGSQTITKSGGLPTVVNTLHKTITGTEGINF